MSAVTVTRGRLDAASPRASAAGMSEPTLAAPASGTEARPVDVSERVVLLDVLRGFALCGVFVSNSFTWFSGRNLLPREQAQALAAPLLEVVVTSLYQFFVNQKFVTLFSFLFGLGFSIQLRALSAGAASIVPLYSRRLLVLLGIGLTHLFGIWMGDVLSTYALVGFVLLLFRQRSDRTVLIWVVVLVVVVPLLVPLIQHYGPILLHGAQAAAEQAKAAEEYAAQMRAQFLAGPSERFLLDGAEGERALLLRGHAAQVPPPALDDRHPRPLPAGPAGGAAPADAGRGAQPRLAPPAARLGAGAGRAGQWRGVVVQRLRLAGLVDPAKDAWMVIRPLQELGYLGLAAVYVAAFALLFQRERWRRRMLVLAPVGRMALTNYLMQSVVSLCLYDGWGLGLMGKLPPSRCVALTLAVFALQIPFSHWWLSRFRFGPAEWLWRSLTYGRAQPMRLAPGSAPGSAASSSPKLHLSGPIHKVGAREARTHSSIAGETRGAFSFSACWLCLRVLRQGAPWERTPPRASRLAPADCPTRASRPTRASPSTWLKPPAGTRRVAAS